MTIVLDTTVVVKMLVPEIGRDQALRLLAETDRKIAPTLLKAELCNALYRRRNPA